jgi:hypothetical protein
MTTINDIIEKVGFGYPLGRPSQSHMSALQMLLHIVHEVYLAYTACITLHSPFSIPSSLPGQGGGEEDHQHLPVRGAGAAARAHNPGVCAGGGG